MDKKLLKASERWIKEGRKYKDAINAWLDIIYVEGKQPKKDCPEEPRKDMADYVIEQLVEFNKAGRHEEFRKLFPADNDPLGDAFDNYSWYNVRKVAILLDGTIAAKMGDYYEWQGVYLIKDDKFTLVDGLFGFGFSYDKKYYAKVWKDRIEVCDGWDGPVVSLFDFPEGYDVQSIEYDSIEVFSDGKQVVLTTHRGVFLINEKSCALLHGSLEGEEVQEIHWHTAAAGDEPERPANLPKEAVWCGEGEWTYGKNNAEGKSVGEWKWFAAPDGNLVSCAVYEGDSEDVYTFDRYHKDGTMSEAGKYVDGKLFGEMVYYRSDNPTTEYFPPEAGANVFKTVCITKNGDVVEQHYYDKQGNECQEPLISDAEMSELLKKLSITDRMYIERDWKRLLAAAEELIDTGEAEDDDMDQMKAVYYKAYASYQLAGKENIVDLEDAADTILDLYSFTLCSFLSEFNVARSALRFAYYIKARLAIAADDWEEARDQLRETFDVASPIDDEDIAAYEALKDRIIEKLGNFDDNGEHKNKFLDYPHAAVSPDDKYIAVGSYWGPHIVMVEKDGQWIETAQIEQRSEYPNIACFNYVHENPCLAFSSCHFSRSATLGLFLKNIEGMRASGRDMDSEDLFVIDGQKWVFSMYPSQHGFYLGTNEGYIWRKIIYNVADYVFIGGTVMSIDISSDKKHMIVGTSAGQVVVLRMEPEDDKPGKNPRIDPYLITNLPLMDEKRYVFMVGEEPMIW